MCLNFRLHSAGAINKKRMGINNYYVNLHITTVGGPYQKGRLYKLGYSRNITGFRCCRKVGAFGGCRYRGEINKHYVNLQMLMQEHFILWVILKTITEYGNRSNLWVVLKIGSNIIHP